MKKTHGDHQEAHSCRTQVQARHRHCIPITSLSYRSESIFPVWVRLTCHSCTEAAGHNALVAGPEEEEEPSRRIAAEEEDPRSRHNPRNCLEGEAVGSHSYAAVAASWHRDRTWSQDCLGRQWSSPEEFTSSNLLAHSLLLYKLCCCSSDAVFYFVYRSKNVLDLVRTSFQQLPKTCCKVLRAESMLQQRAARL